MAIQYNLKWEKMVGNPKFVVDKKGDEEDINLAFYSSTTARVDDGQADRHQQTD